MTSQDKIIMARESQVPNTMTIFLQSGTVAPVKVLGPGILPGPHSLAHGCQHNGSLVIAGLSDDGVQVKNMTTGKHQKYFHFIASTKFLHLFNELYIFTGI